jgi:hypothetical protein
MKFFPLYFLLSLFSTASLIAQDDPETEPRKPLGRVAWFVSTSIPKGMENPMTVQSGDELLQVTLSKRSPSDPVKIPADGILRIVRKVENPKDPGKPAYLTLGQAIVPEAMGKALIILIPAAENPAGRVFDTKVMNLAEFKGGSWLFLNTTETKVGVDLGGSKIEIKPGESKVIGNEPSSTPKNMAIRYYFQHPKKSEWKVLSTSTVVTYPTRREICIFSWDPRYKRVDYHGITFPVME